MSNTVVQHPHNHTEHGLSTMEKMGIGAALITGTLIAAPYVLSALNIGDTKGIAEAHDALHNVLEGSGLALSINNFIKQVPIVGESVASGGWAAFAATAGTGLGGSLLGKFIEDREDGSKKVSVGRIIKYASLVTSALVALPSLLSGISVGLVYLSDVMFGVKAAGAIAKQLSGTLGAVAYPGSDTQGLGGLAAAAPHLLTCGGSIAPIALSTLIQGKDATLLPIAMEVQSAPTSANAPTNVRLRLTRADGTPLTADEIAVTHTQKLHVFMVDQSLKDYQHIHPIATSEPGVFEFQFTPNTSNKYTAWAEFNLARSNENVRTKAELPALARRNISPSVKQNSHSEKGALHFEWYGQPMQKGKDSMVEVSISDANGNPITNLEPIMGAYAHLVGFTADGKEMVHSHPLGREPIGAHDRGGPDLQFHLHPESAGMVQFYLQVRHNGQDIYAPFGQPVRYPERLSERYAPHAESSHSHGMHL